MKRIPDLARAIEVDPEAQRNPTSMFQKKPDMGALVGRNIALELRVLLPPSPPADHLN